MSLWDTIKGWFAKKESPKVREERKQLTPDVTKLFLEVCQDAGIGAKLMNSTNATSLFLDWYQGAPTKQAIADSMLEFITAQGGAINAKFSRFIK